MNPDGSTALVIAGALSVAASLAHIACIVIGAPAYRFMGAGERMALAAERSAWAPTLMTSAIVLVLAVWALYAFSAAGLVSRLPLLRLVLVLVTLIYLMRAVAFPFLRPMFPENTLTFWIVSSGICLVFGLVHLVGLVQAWPRLSNVPG